ncbi:MAG TPA: 3-oxoacyl-ACP reductase family protein [Tepidisphaeraceae bacterium]|jgi:3-oxoacyl-[acyl-carrier protein] reductase|nr:3-oxoacyl-ACP reductase family protein [Tepidisphaeraceae bacterium]
MDESLDLSGKVALITGGSRGIGEAIARLLDRHGARCVVNYVADSEGRNRADAELAAGGLKDPLLIAADVGDDGQTAAMFGQISGAFGGLDILVNNAGILRDRSLRKMTREEWDAVIRVNLTGAFNCLHHAAGILRPGGRVVSISSVSAHLGLFGQANYAAAKAGLIALTKVTARELAKQQITVNAVAPGFVATDMTRDMPADVMKKFVEQIPLGRVGRVDDIANAVLFLCSPLAEYITGHVLDVNGGFYMG